ncbi:MAG: tRNA lysidine(34) synthetase TilS [Oscillospiraceae bacterium]|nr:tRNA lysidine(34) synthetase TilS [Oscillospiraceae bacterium]
MLNKLLAFIRQQKLMEPGDSVTVACSGGPDSIALLFALYLLKDKLKIQLSAAHFNHLYRGEEGYRDENHVRAFCERFDIPLTVGRGEVIVGKKGLEAAARDARYAFLRSLPGRIATAHTADDNAETVLLHLVRGTGLKGLGGIPPVNGNVIRPLLSVTQREVEEFCAEWSLDFVTDSTNPTDKFLRNRLRHHVLPLLRQENPQFAVNASAMALRLRQDEDCLSSMSELEAMDVTRLREMHPALRSRCLESFLKRSGVREPEASHIAQAESLVFSPKPSAFARFPGGVVITRNYYCLEVRREGEELPAVELPVPGSVIWGDYRITASLEGEGVPVYPTGTIIVRSRASGDAIRLSGGTKSLKKLFIDRKIPAARRSRIPVLCDEAGILAVEQIGIDQSRQRKEQPVWIQIEKI